MADKSEPRQSEIRVNSEDKTAIQKVRDTIDPSLPLGAAARIACDRFLEDTDENEGVKF